MDERLERAEQTCAELVAELRSRHACRSDLNVRYPHIHDLLALRARVAEQIRDWRSGLQPDVLRRSPVRILELMQAAANFLGELEAEFDNCLARLGLEQVDASAPFDPTRHRVAARVVTADPAASGQVAEVLAPGFTWVNDAGSQRVLRPATVAVFVCEQPERNHV